MHATYIHGHMTILGLTQAHPNKAVIFPYTDDARKRLGLSPQHTGLVILDHFDGQTTQKVLNVLEEYHLTYICVVPANCSS